MLLDELYSFYKFQVDQWHYYQERSLGDGESQEWLDDMIVKSKLLVDAARDRLDHAREMVKQ